MTLFGIALLGVFQLVVAVDQLGDEQTHADLSAGISAPFIRLAFQPIVVPQRYEDGDTFGRDADILPLLVLSSQGRLTHFLSRRKDEVSISRMISSPSRRSGHSLYACLMASRSPELIVWTRSCPAGALLFHRSMRFYGSSLKRCFLILLSVVVSVISLVC